MTKAFDINEPAQGSKDTKKKGDKRAKDGKRDKDEETEAALADLNGPAESKDAS